MITYEKARQWCVNAHGEQKYGKCLPYSFHLDAATEVALRSRSQTSSFCSPYWSRCRGRYQQDPQTDVAGGISPALTVDDFSGHG